MKLSFWEKDLIDNADYAIVGAGITGLSLASEILEKEPSARVVVFEKGSFPSGGSTKNAGFLCFGSLTELDYDIETLGEEIALQNALSRHNGLKKTLQRLKGRDIGFESCGGYDLIAKDHAWSKDDLSQKIGDMNGRLRQIIGEDVYFLSEKGKFPFKNIKALVKNSYEGAAHSGKIFQALLTHVQSLGAKVLFGAEALGYEASGLGVSFEVAGAGGWKEVLSSSRIAFCTDAFLSKTFPSIDVVPGRGQIAIIEGKDFSLPAGTYHAEEGYFYFRHLPGDKILFGGGRHLHRAEEECFSFDTTKSVQATISKKFEDLFGSRPIVTHSWSGLMAFGSAKTPLILRKEEGVFLAGRTSGIGLAEGSNIASNLYKLMKS